MFVGTVVSAASSRKQARLLLPRLPRLNPGITVVGAAVADAQAGESAASPAAKSGFMTRTSGMAGLTVEREARRDAAACGAERASSIGFVADGLGTRAVVRDYVLEAEWELGGHKNSAFDS